MIETIFSEETRRNPYPFYAQHRATGVLHAEPMDLWMVLSYDGVKSALESPAVFSSAAVPPGSTGKPLDWLIFKDGARHARLRGLISRAFTPRVVANLDPRIRQISRKLLEIQVPRGEMDIATDYAIPLPLMVIAQMLGITPGQTPRFRRWCDAILNLAETVSGGSAATSASEAYSAATAEMDGYLLDVLSGRGGQSQGDLLLQLATVDVDGERLTRQEILGFFQLLLVAGSETTTNLINNALLCLLEHPDQLVALRRHPQRLPATIEEVLRYRSPIQAIFRQTTRATELHGQVIPAGKLVLLMIGSANRDPSRFDRADCFDPSRPENPHLAFGHGVHFCLGAALSRLEATIALGDLLARLEHIEFAQNEPWEPRVAFHVLGPARLPIRFQATGEERVLQIMSRA